ncbi:MAG: enoyl-CoA hydratase/isomerase family protein [Rhizobiaceae bacterium]|nr:enoyl-CoA hydratase/isomerase family protein [Rhizobiaceae bacterium]
MVADGSARTAFLTLEVADHIARLTINRPDRRNALTHDMWRELAALVDRACAHTSTRVLVITGTGNDFSAGADIAEFDTVRRDTETARSYEAANSAAFAAIRNAPVPTLASIRGACIGGGFGIAAACDLRIAAEDAVFAVPAAKLGLAYPHEAMSDIVHACGPQVARYLTFTGARISASQALTIGFLAEVIQDGDLRVRTDDIAGQVAASAPLSVRASKAAIRAVLSGNPGDAERAAVLGAATFDSADYAEGRAAFKERRSPQFRGE